MATKIILTVDETLTAQETELLRHLLCDAFAEFQHHRFPVRAYVEQRYPDNGIAGCFTWDEKTKEVQRRVDLAKKLHHAAFGMRIVDEPTYVNHAMCAAEETPCSPTCKEYWTGTNPEASS